MAFLFPAAVTARSVLVRELWFNVGSVFFEHRACIYQPADTAALSCRMTNDDESPGG